LKFQIKNRGVAEVRRGKGQDFNRRWDRINADENENTERIEFANSPFLICVHPVPSAVKFLVFVFLRVSAVKNHLDTSPAEVLADGHQGTARQEVLADSHHALPLTRKVFVRFNPIKSCQSCLKIPGRIALRDGRHE
jgi:hypothetical protein